MSTLTVLHVGYGVTTQDRGRPGFSDMGLGAAAGRLLPEVDWEREAYPAYDDFLALPAFVLFFPTVRFFLDRFVFEVRPPSPSSFLSFFRSAVASVRFLDSGS